jgi:DNA invertase Pin-like site-specific DNA recombinase
LSAICRNNGLTTPEEVVFLDEDASGSLPLKDREQGRLMMNTLQIYGKRVRHLIVAKLDRLGRSLIDLQLTVAELESKGSASIATCRFPPARTAWARPCGLCSCKCSPPLPSLRGT